MAGILSEPLNSGGPDGRSSNQRRRKVRGVTAKWPQVVATKGLLVRHRTTNYTGPILRFTSRQVTILDNKSGREQTIPVAEGAFSVEGRSVSLVSVQHQATAKATAKTASGSKAPTKRKARVARASRILVEGIHDAELVEKVWGDDLRSEGVVVEPLHGADDLVAIVADFDPTKDRRLGILLDHLVDRSKESRLAAQIDNPHVLITGHHYVDIWQAIKPQTLSISEWPTVPKGQDWKTGICRAWKLDGEPGELWKKLLGRVSSYADLEADLVGAVEQLLDFVAPPPTDD